ncbi:hypothetical protein [Caproicibacterium amylolyticum]|uniref:Uncharacterized protein n=1 Tax=Caproicibacterium amylolyticum TaxID=2766537 RepID=A0A7G9WJG8_9FIRM|nr:hypothetical protein [Caproicibacterium amylolyticum]QNO18830.1 hypothetical protein H6X83_04125 [Caproicibacterium amylolyticum]
MKEIHFYFGSNCEPYTKVYHDFYSSRMAIWNDEVVHTTQLVLLSTKLFEQGFKVFIHTVHRTFEVKLGKNEITSRIVKPESNILKLLFAGGFGSIE